MFTFAKTPQSIGSVLDDSFKLYKAAIKKIWPWALLLAVVMSFPIAYDYLSGEQEARLKWIQQQQQMEQMQTSESKQLTPQQRQQQTELMTQAFKQNVSPVRIVLLIITLFCYAFLISVIFHIFYTIGENQPVDQIKSIAFALAQIVVGTGSHFVDYGISDVRIVTLYCTSRYFSDIFYLCYTYSFI